MLVQPLGRGAGEGSGTRSGREMVEGRAELVYVSSSLSCEKNDEEGSGGGRRNEARVVGDRLGVVGRPRMRRGSASTRRLGNTW